MIFFIILGLIAQSYSEPPPVQYSAYSNYEPPVSYQPKYSYPSHTSSSPSVGGDAYSTSVGDLGEGGYTAGGDDYGYSSSSRPGPPPRPSRPYHVNHSPSRPYGMPSYRTSGRSPILVMSNSPYHGHGPMSYGHGHGGFRPMSMLYRRYKPIMRPHHFGPPAPPPTPKYAYSYGKGNHNYQPSVSYISDSPPSGKHTNEYSESHSHSYLPPIYSSAKGSSGGGGKSSSSSSYSSQPISTYSKYPTVPYTSEAPGQYHDYYTSKTPPSPIGYKRTSYKGNLIPPVSSYPVSSPEASPTPYGSYDGSGILTESGNEEEDDRHSEHNSNSYSSSPSVYKYSGGSYSGSDKY